MFVYQMVFHVTPVRAARPRHGSLHLVLLVGCSGHRWGMVVTRAVCFRTVFLEFVRIIDRFCVKNHLKCPQIIHFHGIFHYKPSILKYNYTSGSPDRWRWRERERTIPMAVVRWQSSMGDLQDPIHGGTLVPYFWPYFVGIFPYIGLKNKPYIW